MDNQIFNVNGKNLEELKLALDLVGKTGGYGSGRTASGWSINPEKGLILHWSIQENNTKVHKFITELSMEDTAPQVWAWLQSDEAKAIPNTGWDVDMDHDGHNTLGWRVYVEDWGHIGDDWSAICAIKLAWLWHGK